MLSCAVICAVAAVGPYGQAQAQALTQQPPPAYPANGGISAPQSSARFPGPGSLNYVQGEVSSDGQTLNADAVGRFSLQPNQTLQTNKAFSK